MAERRKSASAAAVSCCLLIVLLWVQHPQAAAMSPFCGCYQTCYPDCRMHLPRWLCILKCMDDCSPTERILAPTSTGDCDRICRLSICGSGTGPTDIGACVDDCTKNFGTHHAPNASMIN